MSATTTVDPSEIAKFEAMAAEWWDLNGKFKPLHMMNPVRLDYITRQIAAEFGRDVSQPDAFKGLRILDIGCGFQPSRHGTHHIGKVDPRPIGLIGAVKHRGMIQQLPSRARRIICRPDQPPQSCPRRLFT